MLLLTEELTKNYGRICALDHLDLAVPPGEVFGLLGPNGSGKSTAIRLLLGFMRPTFGRAHIAGQDCWADSVDARRFVSYLPGELRLYENMTGRQLCKFLGSLRGRTDLHEVDELARPFDIDLDRPISVLSSGMKRKVALLLVLAPHTPLVILDEPTNTLDPTMRDVLLGQLLQAKRRGQAVLFSSHVLAEVERVCDRVGILQRGKLVHVQQMAELRESRQVLARFSRPVERVPTFEGLARAEWHGDELTMETSGPLSPLLHWLASQPVVDLRVEPLGLSGIYNRYHGATA
jgi:ABC-2 type transport system ATP-binding protein